MRLRLRHWTFAAAAAITLVSCAFWFLHFDNRRLSRQLRAVDAVGFPTLIEGYPLPTFRTEFELRSAFRVAERHQSPHYTLIFLSADTCPHCPRAVEMWQRLVADVRIRDRVGEFLLLSFSGTKALEPLAEEIRKFHLASRLVLVSPREAFMRKTGLIMTPLTVLVDCDSRIRMVTSDATPEGEAVIAGIIRSRPACGSVSSPGL